MSAPIRVLELRSVWGTGGGPDKTILAGAHRTDGSAITVTLCYLRSGHDPLFPMRARAEQLGLDYVEIPERHALDPAIWRSLREVVRSRHIDIVHAHEYKTDLLAYLLARATSTVPLATAHGWTGHSWRERRVYYPGDKRLLKRFPKVIAVSNDVRQALLAVGADDSRIEVLLNGIDARAFRRDHDQRKTCRARFDLAADSIAVGAVGRLEPQKRFDILIEVIAALRSSHPRLRLLIAGEGSARAALERQIQRLALGDVCRLVGHVDVIPFHHALDLFVQSSDYEGTPNVVLEAMALETPIVATAVGGTAEIVTDDVHALLVPPARVDLLGRAIARAVDDSPAAARRVAAARRRVETELSFDRRMDRLDAIYRESLNGRGSIVRTSATFTRNT